MKQQHHNMKLFTITVMVLPILAIQNLGIINDQEESLANALLTMIFKFYVKQSNTILVTKGGLGPFDQTYAAILWSICAKIDKTLTIKFLLNERMVHGDRCNIKSTNNIILVDSYESFR